MIKSNMRNRCFADGYSEQTIKSYACVNAGRPPCNHQLQGGLSISYQAVSILIRLKLLCLVKFTRLQDYFLICYKCYLHRFYSDIFDTSDLILRWLLYVKSVVECNTPTSRKPTHTRFTQNHRILKISCMVLCSFNMRSSVFIFIQRTIKETVGRGISSR